MIDNKWTYACLQIQTTGEIHYKHIEYQKMIYFLKKTINITNQWQKYKH